MSSPARVETAALLEFMFRLGQAYLACGEQTAQVELLLRRVAAAYGMRKSRVVAFPTALFITLHDETGERVTLAEGPLQALRLDQMADVYALGAEAQQGAIAPEEGLKRLTEIQRKRPRFGRVGTVAGHAILSMGLAIVLSPSLANLAAAVLLGGLVGALKLANRDQPVLSIPLPVVAATLVSTLVFLALKQGLPVEPLHVLIPPLVTFLPGAMLTFGMVELAYGDMVSGTSRLVTGFVQLVLLTFGLAAGALMIGYTPDKLLEASGQGLEVPLASWVGVLVFGLGVHLHFSAPRRSLPWILAVLLLAFAAQQAASQFVAASLSGFFGTLVATPLAYLIQLRFQGPPATVTFLPAFWLLVPGALGLLSITRMLSDRAAGVDGLVSAVAAITSIGLGTLVGASLYKWLTETFGWWQLQIGRVGSYLRRRGKRSKSPQ